MGLQSDVSQAAVVGQSGHRPIRREKGWTWLNTYAVRPVSDGYSHGFGGRTGRAGRGDMEEHVTYQDNRLSCKAQNLRKAKDNRFEDFC